MRHSTDASRWLCASAALFLISALPAAAQFPDPECDPSLAPADASIPVALLSYCSTSTATPAPVCDLKITPWDTTTHRSPDIRIGEPFSPSGPTPAEVPRFFFDEANNRFYTKLYTRFDNGLGTAPAAATEVRVDFSFTATSNPSDATLPTTVWDPAGTGTVSSYQMNIPAPAPFGALFPSNFHAQQRAVCWSLSPGVDFPRQFILRAEVQWGEDNSTHGDPANNVAYSYYDLSSYERKAQIAFAIDLSGSMTGSKLVEAKQKAMLFTNLVENDNQLGVYGFATNNPANSPFSATYNGTDPPNSPVTMNDTSEISQIKTLASDLDRLTIAGDIWGQTAHGCTPVGQGLLRARKGLGELTPPAGPPAPGKAIVLFSDGLQNVRPFVNSTPPWTCGSSSTAPIVNAMKTFGAEEIEIYSVYFGPEVGWAYNLMNDIKDQTGGDYIYGASTGLELAAAYYAIRALVDDMIFFEEEESTSIGGPWPTFEVELDAAADLATVAVAWPYGDGNTRLTVDYRKKGESRWRSSDPLQTGDVELSGASYRVFRFRAGPDSTWQFQVRRKPEPELEIQPTGETSYTAAVFSAVLEAQIFASLDDVGFTTGDDLGIEAELRTAGGPLTGATVTAEVKVPARSFSSTLRRYADRFTASADPDANRVSGMAAQLRKFLGQDDLYPVRAVTVMLNDAGHDGDRQAGDGVYGGMLPGAETRVAGDYEVTVKASAEIAGRTVERIARLSTICNVGPADPDLSEVTIAVSPDPAGDLRAATVTVVPVDRFGNAAFPGSGGLIGISATDATLRGDLADNLDASFTQRLTFDPADDPRVAVTVGGQPIGSFPVTPAQPRGKELSFHFGLATPHGAFGNVFSGGESFAVDFAYRLDRSFALKLELADDRFDLRSGGSRDLVSLSAYLQYRRPRGLWTPYFETGLGVYDLESAGSALGFAAGIGLRRELTPRWDLDLNLQGHQVGGSLDLSFSRLRVGGILRF